MNKYRKEPYIIQREGKNGWTFLVRIRTDGVEVSKSFAEKDYPSSKIAYDTAVHFRNRMLYEIQEGSLEKENAATVEDMFNEYIDSCASSINTKEHLRKLFNKYVSCKEKRIQQVTKADILKDLNAMVESASDDTIQRVYFVWKQCIVGTALLREIIKRDLCLGVVKPKSKLVMKHRGVETDRETLDIIKKGLMATTNHYEARIIGFMLEVIYYTGMRPAEAEALTREDIGDTHISVNKQLGSSTESYDVAVNCKSERSVRRIPIHPKLRPILDELLEYSKYDILFAGQDGRYMNSTKIGFRIKQVCKAKNVEFNLYRLRHNMATELITNKVDDRTTMDLLGHAQYAMSLYYATSNEELKEEAINLFS